MAPRASATTRRRSAERTRWNTQDRGVLKEAIRNDG